MAARFKDSSKSTVYRLVESLVNSSWFVKIENDCPRRKDGTFAATEYRIIDHDEWVKTHGSKQCEPVPPVGMDLYQNEPQPVPPVGHKYIEPIKYIKEKQVYVSSPSPSFSFEKEDIRQNISLRSTSVPPVPPVGLDTPALVFWQEHKKWGAHPDIGRPLTQEEIQEMNRRNIQ